MYSDGHGEGTVRVFGYHCDQAVPVLNPRTV